MFTRISWLFAVAAMPLTGMGMPSEAVSRPAHGGDWNAVDSPGHVFEAIETAPAQAIDTKPIGTPGVPPASPAAPNVNVNANPNPVGSPAVSPASASSTLASVITPVLNRTVPALKAPPGFAIVEGDTDTDEVPHYSAKIINKCSFPLTLRTIDGAVERDGITNPPLEFGPYTLPPNASYLETLREPCQPDKCGVALKLTSPHQKGLLQFEYTTEVQTKAVWGDISFVNCAVGTSAADCPVWEHGMKWFARMPHKTEPCFTFTCPPGVFCPEAAYYEPAGTAFGTQAPCKDCGPHASIVFVACEG